MVVIKACMNGSYPRSKAVARLYSRLSSGKLSIEDFEEGIRNHTKKFFELLKNSGVRLFTDGMLRWDDIFNPLIRYVNGVKINGLVRFFDNNFFFRAPKVVGKLDISDNPIPKWFNVSISIAKRVFGDDFILKQVIPGPFTLAMNSINQYYSNLHELIHDWRVNVLEPLIKSLVSVGLSVIEVHEPSLVWGNVSSEVLRYGVKEVSELIKFCKHLGVDIWLLTYFRSLTNLNGLVSDLVDAILGIDFFSKDLKRPYVFMEEYGIKRVMLGLIDSRNTLMEKASMIRRVVSRVLDAGVNEVYVGNNAPMDFIPEVIAAKKIRKLGRVVNKLLSSLLGD